MKPRILLIDDDRTQHALHRHILEREGFAFASAFDGRSGLKAMQELQPNLVLLDFMLPEMDGGEVLRTIHTDPLLESCRRIPVIMLTAALHEVNSMREYLDKGLAVYLRKPFGGKELVEIINNTLYTNAIWVRDRTLFRAIHESRDFLENLLDNCPVLILTIDRTGKITYCNRASKKLSGLDNKKLIGQAFSSLWKSPDGEVMSLLDAPFDDMGHVLQQQGDLVGDGGRVTPLAMTFTVLMNNNSSPMGLLAVGEDLTTLRELQKQMMDKERLLGITEALATVNHEINNPLTPIIGNVQLLLTGATAFEDSVTQKLQSIEVNARRIQEIIQKMSRLSRPIRKQYYGDEMILDLQHSV